MSRRDFIRVGGLTALGFGLADFFHLQNTLAAKKHVNRKSKIMYPNLVGWGTESSRNVRPET